MNEIITFVMPYLILKDKLNVCLVQKNILSGPIVDFYHVKIKYGLQQNTFKHLHLFNFLGQISTTFTILNPKLNTLQKTLAMCKETPFINLNFEKSIIPFIKYRAKNEIISGYKNTISIYINEFKFEELKYFFLLKFKNFKYLKLENIHTNCKNELKVLKDFVKKQEIKLYVCSCTQ